MDTTQSLAETTISRPTGRRRFITCRGEHSSDEIDLELPADCPLGELLPDVIKALNWPQAEAGRPLKYGIRGEEDGPFLDEGGTLAQAGIENFDKLWVVLVGENTSPQTQGAIEADSSAAAGIARGFRPVADTDASPQSRRGRLAPPRPVHLEIREPSLVSEAAGVIFVLGTPPISIGRPGRGGRPDIDLSEIDPGKISSRPAHANIEHDGKGYVLRTRKTLNGTIINGAEIPANEVRPLNDGDRIEFGFRGVELTFRLPQAGTS